MSADCQSSHQQMSSPHELSPTCVKRTQPWRAFPIEVPISFIPVSRMRIVLAALIDTHRF
ncbi:hypothetical protein WN55_05106 [Dufourea novaeangliae]|uniref:Uncharacterized protein n=1 Tax=Dufourea novaeangliae TaxID=178035 RepID=A0A154PQB0_DUFNO|nr:hypothetical protein WN55_05106 [Dufourea novaeangliae]